MRRICLWIPFLFVHLIFFYKIRVLFCFVFMMDCDWSRRRRTVMLLGVGWWWITYPDSLNCNFVTVTIQEPDKVRFGPALRTTAILPSRTTRPTKEPDRKEHIRSGPRSGFFSIRTDWTSVRFSVHTLPHVRSGLTYTILPSQTRKNTFGPILGPWFFGFGLNRARSGPGVFRSVRVWPDAHPYLWQSGNMMQ